MRTAEAFPRFAAGWVVIDDRDAPSLRNAIGARVYLTRRTADERVARARLLLAREDAEHLRVVPVEGETDAFALGYIDDGGCTVGANGFIVLSKEQPRT